MLCMLIATSTLAVEPRKSAGDPARYQTLALPNGLQAIVVSDPTVLTAAISLDIAVGNGDNPPDWPGLAHYLEHVFTVGPSDRDSFGGWLARRGGSRNAYTTFEHTNYQVELPSGSLRSGLRRFADWIGDPTFTAKRVDAELEAVEAEFRLGYGHEGRRTLEVLQSVANPAHPYSRFSSGNAATLGGRSVGETTAALQAFYRRHYSARRMTLAVVGPEPLERLADWVASAFDGLPAGNAPPVISPPLFAAGRLPLQVNLHPGGVQRQLQLLFPIPDPRPAYEVRPAVYLSELIGHEGPGSLLALLEAEGLASALAAGTTLTWRAADPNEAGALYGITLDLTADGANDVDSVLHAVFGYLALLRDSGAERLRYQEMARLGELRFRFAERASPRVRAAALAAALHDHEPEDVLSGPYTMTRFDQARIAATLGRLRPENVLLLLTAPGLATDEVSGQHRVPFTQFPVNKERLSTWQDATPDPRLSLPESNPWLPDDFALVAPDTSAAPEAVLTGDLMQAWFAPDASFAEPRGAILAHVRSQENTGTVQQAALLAVYAKVLEDEITAPAYAARLAGLDWRMGKEQDGLAIQVSGFSQHLPAFFAQLLDHLGAWEATPANLERVKSVLANNLHNRDIASPAGRRVLDNLATRVRADRFPLDEMASALAGVNAESLTAFHLAFWSGANARMLVVGNLTREGFDLAAARLEALLDPGAAAPPAPAILRLPGDTRTVDIPSPAANAGDTAAAWYVQGPGSGWRHRAHLALAAELLRARLFAKLRDDQQIGYLLDAFSWPQGDIPGVVLLVQSPSHTADEVLGALQEQVENLDRRVSRAEFDRRKTSLQMRLETPYDNLSARVDALWTDLMAGNVNFDTRERLSRAVTPISREGWRDAYRETFLEDPHSLRVTTRGADSR